MAFAFPPARTLDVGARADAADHCRDVRRHRLRLGVYVLRGQDGVTCAAARAVVRASPVRTIAGWRAYDWRRAQRGPWTWVYLRDDRGALVAAIARG